MIPRQVYQDVVIQGRGRAGTRAVQNAIDSGWMRVIDVTNRELIPRRFIGKGEGEAIALAQEQNADVILLDDRAARNFCERTGLPSLHTGGILRDAKRRKLIRRMKPLLDRMQAKGFGVWDYEEILRIAGE